MNVRFKLEYSGSNPRMAYELVSDELVIVLGKEYLNTKLLGLVLEYKMEITNDPTDIPAIEPFVKLANMQK